MIEQFIPIFKLPNISELENKYVAKGKQTLLILEDLQSTIASLTLTEQNSLVSFITRSRHNSISVIYVQHSFGYAGNTRHNFDKLFTENATYVVMFIFLANQLHSNIFAGRIFGDKMDGFKKCVEMAKKIAEKHEHNRACVVISNDVRQNLQGLSRVRTDIFDMHIIFKDGL